MLAALVLGTLLPAGAATNFVAFGGTSSTFRPSVISINAGDTVVWTNAGSIHTVTGSSGELLCGDTQFSAVGAGCTNTFNTPGNYAYSCQLHSFSGMTGLVVVASSSATHTVQIGDFFFNPTNLNITVGDTVVWTNAAERQHDSQSSSDLWHSANMAAHATYSFQFTNAGIYPYYCEEHIINHPEQTGAVVVAEVTLPSFVFITDPTNNSLFPAPASFNIQAGISNNVTVTNVQFFKNGVLMSEASIAPYFAFADNLVGGNYTFTARALNNSGVAATSAPVSVQVLTRAMLSGLVRNSSSFQFTVNAITGQAYIAEFSTNLASWQPFATNTNATATFNFTNSNATDSTRYYRVRQDLK